MKKVLAETAAVFAVLLGIGGALVLAWFPPGETTLFKIFCGAGAFGLLYITARAFKRAP